jgi:hypothetical protein
VPPRWGRSRALQLLDLAALPMNPCPHPLDFAPNMLDVRHGLTRENQVA